MTDDKRLNEVIRVQKRKNNFVIIDKTFLDDERLSYKAKGILAYLLSKPDDWKVVIKDLINHSIDGERAIYSGLNELKTNGYYEKSPVKNEKGRIVRWESTIYELPRETTANPLCCFVQMENADVENVDVENRNRNNNYYNNNDLSNNKVSESAPAPAETTYGESQRVNLTESEYNSLLELHGEAKTADYINRLNYQIACKGAKYKNHYIVINKWIDEDERKQSRPSESKSQPKQNKFANFESRTIDFSEIERKERELLLSATREEEKSHL